VLVTVSGATDVGLERAHNEDALVLDGFVSTSRHAHLEVALAPTRGSTVIAVVDGMGGHAAGDRASRLVAHLLADAGPSAVTPDDVTGLIVDAHGAVRAEMAALPSTAGMGATVAGVLLRAEGPSLVFNVGDSRVYEIIDGCLVQISVDDSPPRPAGMPEDARMVLITQAIGTNRAEAPTPHLHAVDLAVGSRLLLCSDGLTDYASLDRIEELLADPATDASTLCELACAGGGGDNVSVVLVTVTG
jgi:serine/threonine protein phosphatase PrpC